jgi:class 3 adenylate cyclase/predicted ATPase
MLDVARWLAEQGLGHHAEAFAENGIAGDVLRDLTDADLRELGLNLGDRKRLLKAIAALTAGSTDTRAETPAGPAVPHEAERRQLTVMFVDLVGSTELAGRLDPEDMSTLIRAYQNAVAGEIARFEGHIAKYMGDGVLAYFGWPKAHEGEPERAVRAGLAITGAVGHLSAPGGEPLAARIGIATGLVMVGELIGEGAAQEQAVVGETPNLAARLQALAQPGSVVIAASTRRLVGGLFELADLGPQRLKGFAEPLAAWRVVAIGAAEDRFEAMHAAGLTPMVGREQELGILLERWAWAKDGDGQVVLLSGEPGIGKSHLVRMLRERLADQSYTPLSHYCSPYHTNSALHPVIGLLERAAGLEREDQPTVRRAKLEALLALGTEHLGEVVPLIAALLEVPIGENYPPLNLTPERQKQRTLEVLVDQVAGLAAREPVLAIYEDVHWIDATTLEALGLLIERVRRLPVLVLITYRPEFTPPWSGHAHVLQLSLTRLTRSHGAALVERIIGGKALPAEVRDQILAKTDGVPLFVEELTKTVLESGLLTDAGDRYELAGPVPALAIPATLHDSLMARLDNLAPAKNLIQTGAVIGREFSHELLGAVARLPAAELDVSLDRLVASELVFRHGIPPAATYRFKHALVQEAAYQSLPKSRRCDLHARVAALLEQRFPQVAGTEPELVAHHWSEAGVLDKAMSYWSVAGRRAVEHFANPEAIAHFSGALELLGAFPEGDARDRRELELRLALTVPLIAVHGFGSIEVERCARRAKEIAARLGDPEHRFTATRAVWNSSLLRHPVPETLALSAELPPLAEATGNPVQLAMAYRARGYSLYIACQLEAALSQLTRGIELADAGPEPALFWIYGEHPGMVCRAYAGQALMLLGKLDRAAALTDEAIAVARRLANPHTLAWALVVAAQNSVIRREFGPAQAQAEEAADLARKHRLPQWLGGATVFRGCALAHSGDLEGGIAEMERGVAHWVGTGAVLHSSHHRAMLAAACCAAGALGRGRTHLAAARRHVDDFGERYAEAELHRVAAQLHLREGAPSDEVVAELWRAIAIAEAQGARLWQLRAAISLARLWAEQGKQAEARKVLVPIYNWFTEGFDTADLKKAGALLDQLAG